MCFYIWHQRKLLKIQISMEGISGFKPKKCSCPVCDSKKKEKCNIKTAEFTDKNAQNSTGNHSATN